MKKYALITGASRGIGAAIALHLAKKYFILLNYKSNHEKAKTVQKQIQDFGGECTLLPFDVSSFECCQKSLELYNNEDVYIS